MGENLRLTEEQLHAAKRKANIAFAEGQEDVRAIVAFYLCIAQQLVPPDEADELVRIKEHIAQAKELCNNMYLRFVKRGLVKPKNQPQFGHTDTGTIGYTQED